MGQLPLGVGAYSRPFGKMPEIRMENRFFEQNPISAEKTSLLSRPGTKLFLNVGTGPIRSLYAQPGVFGGDLFIVSGTKLFRYDGEVITPIEGDVLGTGYPVMTGVAVPGWDCIFITDGVTLQYYEGTGKSEATLSLDGGGITGAKDRINSLSAVTDERYEGDKAPMEAALGNNYTYRFNVVVGQVSVDLEYHNGTTWVALVGDTFLEGETGEKEYEFTIAGAEKFAIERTSPLGNEAWINNLRVTWGQGGDTVRIGDTYYVWTEGDVDVSPQDGSEGAPWRVRLGDSDAEALQNLFHAINLSGTPGLHYGNDTEAHPDVRAFSLEGTQFKVRAISGGDDGDSIVVSTTSSGLTWNSDTLGGGGGHELKLSSVPDGVVISDLATLASFVIAVEANSRKFYWIRPGETDIHPLDFSSAESEPDFIVNVVTVGDQFWLFGQSSTEAWYASGDGDQPFLRTQGRAFSQGILPGTIAKVNESIMVVGQDMVAYRIAGAPERISHHGIEEKLRNWQERLAAEGGA